MEVYFNKTCDEIFFVRLVNQKLQTNKREQTNKFKRKQIA